MTTYRKGYFKALLDVLSLMEHLGYAPGIKPGQRFMILRSILNDVLTNHKLDYFMEQGGKVEVSYRIEKNKVVHMDVRSLDGVKRYSEPPNIGKGW